VRYDAGLVSSTKGLDMRSRGRWIFDFLALLFVIAAGLVLQEPSSIVTILVRALPRSQDGHTAKRAPGSVVLADVAVEDGDSA
jgi:hypothetical protein